MLTAADGYQHQYAGVVDQIIAESSHTHPQIVVRSRLARLRGTRHSRIFVDADVGELLTRLALDAGYQPGQLRWHLRKPLPVLPQCVQAMEDNNQFFHRLVRNHQLLYWFEVEDNRELLVFSDTQLATPFLLRGVAIARPPQGFQRDGMTAFVGFSRCRSVRSLGAGGSVHHRLDTMGNVAELYAGSCISLDDRMDGRMSGDYLCQGVWHHWQREDYSDDKSVTPGYRGKVFLGPRDQPINWPALPSPNCPMLFPATVRSLGPRSPMDADGCYPVRYQFDKTSETSAKSSAPLKKLAWYACANQPQATGWHFPLMGNTRVLIGCVNNNPDDAYLLGFALSSEQASLVNAQNATENRLRTPAGHELIFDDSEQAPKIVLQALNGAHLLELNGQTTGRPFIRWLSRQGTIRLRAGKDMLLASTEADLRIKVSADINAIAREHCHWQARQGDIRGDSANHWRMAADSVSQVAENDLRFDAARGLRCEAGKQMVGRSQKGDLAIRVPKGTVTVQAGKNIDIRGTGQGKIRIHNQGAEINLDARGNVELIGTKMLSLSGTSLLKSGAVSYQIAPPLRAEAPLMESRRWSVSSSSSEDTTSSNEVPDIDDSYLIFADEVMDLAEFARQVYGSHEQRILEHIVRLNPHFKRSFHQLQPGMPVALSPWSFTHEDESVVVKAVAELAFSYAELDDEARRTFAAHHDKLTELMLVMAATDNTAIIADSADGHPRQLQLNHILTGAGSVVTGASAKAEMLKKNLEQFAGFSDEVAKQTRGLKGQKLYNHPAHKEWRARQRSFIKKMKRLMSGFGLFGYLKGIQIEAIGHFLNIDKRQIYKGKGFAEHLNDFKLTQLYRKVMEVSTVLKSGGWAATAVGLYGNVVDISRNCHWGQLLSEACKRATVRNTASMAFNVGVGYSVGWAIGLMPMTGGASISLMLLGTSSWAIHGGEPSNDIGRWVEAVVFDGGEWEEGNR